MGVQLDAGKGRGSVKPTINVTPLVDVVLVLLIIFMVVIPNMQENKPIELFPTTRATEDSEEEKEAIVVTIDEEGVFYLAKEAIPRSDLLAEIRRVHDEEPGRRLLVRGDRRTRYGTIRTFFREVKELGHSNIKLAVGSVTEFEAPPAGN